MTSVRHAESARELHGHVICSGAVLQCSIPRRREAKDAKGAIKKPAKAPARQRAEKTRAIVAKETLQARQRRRMTCFTSLETMSGEGRKQKRKPIVVTSKKKKKFRAASSGSQADLVQRMGFGRAGVVSS